MSRRARLTIKVEGDRLDAAALREVVSGGGIQGIALPKNPLILGVDPGTRCCGWGLVRLMDRRLRYGAHGAVKTGTSSSYAERLLAIYNGLAAAMDEHKPDALSLEKVYHGVNFQSAQKIGEGRALAILAAAQRGIPVHEFSPSEIKLAVSGRGGASKAQVQDLVKIVLGLEFLPEPTDAADALAAAICLGNRVR